MHTFDHENANNILRMTETPASLYTLAFNLQDTSVANYKTIKASDWVTVDAVHELERWTTTDGAITWEAIAITLRIPHKEEDVSLRSPEAAKSYMQVDVTCGLWACTHAENWK